MPRPLRYLLPVVLLCTTIWSVWDPLWQAPDEPQHFGYAESLAELGHRPDREGTITRRTGPGQRAVVIAIDNTSTDGVISLQQTNWYPVAFDLYARPPWGETAERRYERMARDGRTDDGGGRSGATSYPPLYYATETLPYFAAKGATVNDRGYLMRWFSGLWALVSAAGAWLLVGEVLGRRRLPQLVAAATLGLWPMLDFVSAAINPDGMLTALCTLSLWLMVRIARRRTTARAAVALGACVLAATATKVSGAALFPAALFTVVEGLPAVRARTGRRAGPLLGLAAVLLLVPLALLLIGSSAGVLPAQLDAVVGFRPDPRGFASYLWQFYLPKLDSMNRQIFMFPVISDRPVYNLWLGTSWGTFGWVNIWWPKWVYRIFFGLSLLVLGGAFTAGLRAFRARDRDSAPTGAVAIAIILAVAAIAVLAGVHLQDYSSGVSKIQPFAQGRYLFPVAGIGALAVAAAVVALPRRLRPAAAGAWLGFLVVFQLAAFGLLATRFYA